MKLCPIHWIVHRSTNFLTKSDRFAERNTKKLISWLKAEDSKSGLNVENVLI